MAATGPRREPNTLSDIQPAVIPPVAPATKSMAPQFAVTTKSL